MTVTVVYVEVSRLSRLSVFYIEDSIKSVQQFPTRIAITTDARYITFALCMI